DRALDAHAGAEERADAECAQEDDVVYERRRDEDGDDLAHAQSAPPAAASFAGLSRIARTRAGSTRASSGSKVRIRVPSCGIAASSQRRGGQARNCSARAASAGSPGLR